MIISEIFKDALPVIRNFAPMVGSAIGGPAGVATGYALQVLANAFDANPGNVKQLVSNILQDPEAQDKLESIEKDHGDWIGKLINSVNNLSKAEINVKLEWLPESKL